MSTVTNAVSTGLVRAFLKIEQPRLPEDEAIVPIRFNPTEYQIEKQNNFADINIPGLENPPIQFVRGNNETLSMELLVDTSDTLEDVRERYVNRLRDLLNIKSDLHAPPIVRLVWDRQVFRGVVERLSIAYVMFRPDGVPLRARLGITLKQYRPVEVQVRERPKTSPDVEKSYTVQRGDSLSSVAFRVYRDASVWRQIASANGIRDPRRIDPGTVLTLPRLR